MRCHISGVAGAGMNPLACLMRARGHEVQGSDRSFDQGKNREIAAHLRRLAIQLAAHDGTAVTPAIDRFVYSTAVEADTPEMRAARALGLDCVSRPQLLAEVVNAGGPGVAVAGTSGKSTIIGMVAWLLRETGVPATVLGGAALVGEGTGGCFVAGPAEGPVVPQPGLHNLENAAAAALLALELGVDASALEAPLARFPGVARRFEVVGATTSGIRVVDDYAHNGEKIRAAVTTAQAGAPRVVAVFQPHGFGPARFLRQELKELLPRLLRPQDRFCYAEIFYTGGTVAKDVSSRALAADLPAEMRCGYARDHDAVRQWALSEAQAGDTVLIMGARDPDLPRLARKVFESLSVWASSTSTNLLGWR